MAARLGYFLEWLAIFAAVLIVILGVVLIVLAIPVGKLVGAGLFVVAGLVWLLGRGIRYALAGT